MREADESEEFLVSAQSTIDAAWLTWPVTCRTTVVTVGST